MSVYPSRPDAGRLERRVIIHCGRTRDLSALRAPHFGEWLKRGDGAPDADRIPVVAGLTAHLTRAEQIGREFGIRIGILAGLALTAIVALTAIGFAVLT